MSIDFLNPIYYDTNTITEDMPNKPLLVELFEAMNQQNERLWMFFTEMCEDPDHKRMSAMAIKPRQHRPSFKKRKAMADKARTAREEKEEDERGYKAFLKEEGFDDLF